MYVPINPWNSANDLAQRLTRWDLSAASSSSTNELPTSPTTFGDKWERWSETSGALRERAEV